MQIIKIQDTPHSIALVQSQQLLIYDVQSALDLLATVRYDSDCDRLIINKDSISEEFFELHTQLAGEVLQKFVNYRAKLAIVGDFSQYQSKSLQSFIYESNNGNAIFFVDSYDMAVKKLTLAK